MDRVLRGCEDATVTRETTGAGGETRTGAGATGADVTGSGLEETGVSGETVRGRASVLTAGRRCDRWLSLRPAVSLVPLVRRASPRSDLPPDSLVCRVPPSASAAGCGGLPAGLAGSTGPSGPPPEGGDVPVPPPACGEPPDPPAGAGAVWLPVAGEAGVEGAGEAPGVEVVVDSAPWPTPGPPQCCS